MSSVSSGMGDPKVSVILPAWNSHPTIAACLDSLARQTFRDFEIVLVDSSGNNLTEDLVQSHYPHVRYHHHPRRLSAHAARNHGVGLSRGEFLVFSDPDCIMEERWLERLITVVHDRGFAGGAVANAGGGWFEQAVHFTKYAWWLPGGEAQPRPEIPSANMAVSRSLFAVIGPMPEDWCGDTLLSQRAAQAGVTPWFEPRAVIRHDHRVGLDEFLRERFARGYDYGRVRPRQENWSRARCVLTAILFPAVAMVMTARAVRFSAATRHLGHMLAALPVVFSGYLVRAAGEATAHWRAAWRGC